uniref:angiopoietin-4-like isoform X1 n=2 Tax=Myxine glutinosa TaxID=7769 RepID=UPI00358EBA3B
MRKETTMRLSLCAAAFMLTTTLVISSHHQKPGHTCSLTFMVSTDRMRRKNDGDKDGAADKKRVRRDRLEKMETELGDYKERLEELEVQILQGLNSFTLPNATTSEAGRWKKRRGRWSLNPKSEKTIHLSAPNDVIQKQAGNYSLTPRSGHKLPHGPSQGTGKRLRPHRRNATAPRDCAELLHRGHHVSGVYSIKPTNHSSLIKVFCEMQEDGGGWTYMLRREDGSVNFNRSWEDYKMGFGQIEGEHWLGNELIRKITSSSPQRLRIFLQDWDGAEGTATYNRFSIGPEEQHYRLRVAGYTGSLGNHGSLPAPNAPFSTPDQDNDDCRCHCAKLSSAGWWFEACGPSNLNGLYYPRDNHLGHFDGVKWHYWKGSSYSLRSAHVMLKPLHP